MNLMTRLLIALTGLLMAGCASQVQGDGTTRTIGPARTCWSLGALTLGLPALLAIEESEQTVDPQAQVSNVVTVEGMYINGAPVVVTQQVNAIEAGGFR